MLTPAGGYDLSGFATAKAHTAIGDMVLVDIPFADQFIPTTGFNGFLGNVIQIETPNTHITNGFPWGLTLTLPLNINNPASLAISVSSMSFDLYYENVYFGNATLNDVALEIGPNNQATALSNYVKPSNSAVESTFFSKYLQGQTNTLQLVGNSDNILLFQEAMQSIDFNLDFPGQPYALLPYSVLETVDTVSIAMFNPIDTEINVTALNNFNIYNQSNDGYITTMLNTTLSPPFTIEPHTLEVCPQQIGVELVASVASVLYGNSSLFTVGDLTFMVGEYGPVTCELTQNFTFIGISV